MIFDFQYFWDLIGPQQNRTKCPKCRALNAYKAFQKTSAHGLSGDCVELGVWKGGISAMLGRLSELSNSGKVWAFDSFQGMSNCGDYDLAEGEDEVKLAKTPQVQIKNFSLSDFNHTCYEIVGLKKETIIPVIGWVEETLPTYSPKIKSIKILRLDLDWYEPTKLALEFLYEKVVTGGYIICDDYGYWKGARKAIDEFREENKIFSKLIQTPKTDGSKQENLQSGTEHYWIKEN